MTTWQPGRMLPGPRSWSILPSTWAGTTFLLGTGGGGTGDPTTVTLNRCGNNTELHGHTNRYYLFRLNEEQL